MWIVKIKGTHGLSMRAESGGFYCDWVMLRADWGSGMCRECASVQAAAKGWTWDYQEQRTGS